MPSINFSTYTKPAPKVAEFTGNEYTEYVESLIAQTDAWIGEGHKQGDDGQPSFTLEADISDFRKEKLAIQAAARALSKTARIVGVDKSQVTVAGTDESGEPIEEGFVTFSVIVKPKEKARRKGTSGEAASAPETASEEAPEVEVADA